MTPHSYKRVGVIRAAFEYQDLIAIQTLIDFYEDRALYRWVQLDAEDRGFQSVEDVVAFRPDGKYELTQVKFTPDPTSTANTVSWHWLTQRKERTRSLLQKWAATTLKCKNAGTLGHACLKTDRRPEADFLRCLSGTRVDYTLLSSAERILIQSQLGSAEAAQCFFENFHFCHSKPHLDDLDKTLRGRLSSDTDQGGWLTFRQYVRDWSTRKNTPEPDGRITYFHLRQAFYVPPTKTLRQQFTVPTDYSVPDRAFDERFLSELPSEDGVTVLWGPPGRGKSTYLSRCVGAIDQTRAICVRHHYFLSVRDPLAPRLRFNAIARSLVQQMSVVCPGFDNGRANLRECVERTADHLKHQKRRLIIVVDGLDHVWRDHGDHDEMEALFSTLLPLPSNVRLVVGTQRVATEHLPATLLRALPEEQWTELPPMSVESVRRWFSSRLDAGNISLATTRRDNGTKMLSAVAGALYERTAGLPLHLIYSVQALAQTNRPASVDSVRALPACPTGDIHDYYRALWERLGVKARIVLHVMAGLPFSLPQFAFGRCFGQGGETLTACQEISHLVDYRDLAVEPFHGSLFAFVRTLPGHRATFEEHAVHVRTWLTTDAPEYWRWAWLWIMEAELGDPSRLVSGPSRDWAISALVSGYTNEQVITILNHAEAAAWDHFDLCRLMYIRRLKVRAMNGPNFQTQQWSVLAETAISLSCDPYLPAIQRRDMYRTATGAWPFIVRTAPPEQREEVAAAAESEMRRRLKRQREEDAPRSSDQDYVHVSQLVAVSVHRPGAAERILARVSDSFEHHGVLEAFARECLISEQVTRVFKIAKWADDWSLGRHVLAAICLEGLAPSAVPELEYGRHAGLRCLSVIKGRAIEADDRRIDVQDLFTASEYADPSLAHKLRHVVYEEFFDALSAGVNNAAPRRQMALPEEVQGHWFADALRSLQDVAAAVARDWTQGQAWPTVGALYSALRLRRPRLSVHRDRSSFHGVQWGLADVAIDMSLIGLATGRQNRIETTDIVTAAKSDLWNDALWLNWVEERAVRLHSSDAARALVERASQALDENVTEFQERADSRARLAHFAAAHGVQELASQQLRGAMSCVLGYGTHKDMYASEVLDSLDVLLQVGEESVKQTLLDLAGAYCELTRYTDGDETDHITERFFDTIVAHCPDRVSDCVRDLLRHERWRYAERMVTAMAGLENTGSREERALLETFVLTPELAVVAAKWARAGELYAGPMEAVSRKTGAVDTELETVRSGETPGNVQQTTTAHTGRLETSATSEVGPDPRDFAPGALKDFLNAARGPEALGADTQGAEHWLRYWDSVGQPQAALADLKSVSEAGSHDWQVSHALDCAFRIALAAEGRTSAFSWLVRAHRANLGWHEWYTSREDAEGRMQAVSEHYPERWRDFIKETSRPRTVQGAGQESIAVGLFRLVKFCMYLGKEDLARDYALGMADIFQEELEEQPIHRPAWAK